LVVCTQTYYRRFRGFEQPSQGKGADWEGNLITLEIYNARSRTTKFVPIFFDQQDEPFIPEPLRGKSYYLLDSEDDYANLYDFLTGQAGIIPGELGPLRSRAREPAEPLRFGNSHAIRGAISKLYGVADLPTALAADLAALKAKLLGGERHVATSGTGPRPRAPIGAIR